MNSEDRILRALKALQQADRNREAPAAVEAKLLVAFRTGQRAPGGRIDWKFVATLAAAAVVAVLLIRLYGTRHEAVRAGAVRVDVVKNAESVARVEQTPEPARLLKTVAKISAGKSSVSPMAESPREIVTDFFPLMDVAPPLGRGQLLRVAVPARTMRSVGLPVREERLDEPVEADVLIGEEGMVRAIRFVSRQN
jgi:hypothetical protein